MSVTGGCFRRNCTLNTSTFSLSVLSRSANLSRKRSALLRCRFCDYNGISNREFSAINNFKCFIYDNFPNIHF
jgi:hypothetical protein